MRQLAGSILVFSLVFACSRPSHAGTGNAGSSCPYGESLGDGCPSASSSITGSVQHPDFFAAYGPQNGQSYTSATFTGAVTGTSLAVSGAANLLGPGIAVGNTLVGPSVAPGCAITGGGPTTWTLSQACGPATGAMSTMVRPPWNVAGVEYPVGAQNAGLTPMAVTGGGGCPAGITGSRGPTCSTSYLASFGLWNIDARGGSLSISGIDFTASGGGGVNLYNIHGDFLIQNARFAWGANMASSGHWGVSGGGALAFVSFATGNAVTSFLMDHVSMDGYANNGDCCTPTSMATMLAGNPLQWIDSSSTPVTVQYSDFENFNERLYFPCGGTLKYNFFHNMNYNSGIHGEWTVFGTGDPGQTCPLVDIEFNTLLQDDDFYAGMTTALYISNGATHPETYAQTTILNNVYIGNAVELAVTVLQKGPRLVTVSAPTACLMAGIARLGDGPRSFRAALGKPTGSPSSGNCEGTGTGEYKYNGTLSGTSPGTIYYAGGAGSQGTLADLSGGNQTYVNLDCENNFVDPTGSLSMWNQSKAIGCATPTRPIGAVKNTGNINMNLNAQAN